MRDTASLFPGIGAKSERERVRAFAHPIPQKAMERLMLLPRLETR
jgi:hypothetical protein